MAKYTLYVHTMPNGKRYVGITDKDPKIRWGRGGSGYSRNSEFYSDIKQYGWKNVTHTIYVYSSREEAIKWRDLLILQYKTNNPKYGYNTAHTSRTKSNKVVNPANKVACVCLELHQTFESIAEASRKTKTNKQSVWASCQSDGVKSANGKHFVYADKERRKLVKRNTVLKEAESWDWGW